MAGPDTVESPLPGVASAGAPLEPVEAGDAPGVPGDLARRPDTFAFRVRGGALAEEHVCDGDLILVQATAEAREGDTVVALARDEVMVKRFHREAGKVALRSAGGRRDPVACEEGEMEVRGVVVAVIRKYGRPVGNPPPDRGRNSEPCP